jgi:hypothetical protein
MSGQGTYGPDYAPKDSGQHKSKVHWVAVGVSFVAVVVSVIALVASINNGDRAYNAQKQANDIAQENDRIAQENVRLQNQLHAQNQAAEVRSSAQEVVLTTNPGVSSAGQEVQGVTIENQTHMKVTNIYVLFTTWPKSEIVDYAYYAWLGPCTNMTLPFAPSLSLPTNWNAWLYFKDADGNMWVSDVLGSYFSKGKQVPSGGQLVTNELKPLYAISTICQ